MCRVSKKTHRVSKYKKLDIIHIYIFIYHYHENPTFNNIIKKDNVALSVGYKILAFNITKSKISVKSFL